MTHKAKPIMENRNITSPPAVVTMLGKQQTDAQSSEKVERLIYDLHTHQIELEMQNEQLCQAQDELSETRDRYSLLYDYAPVGYLTLGEDALII